MDIRQYRDIISEPKGRASIVDSLRTLTETQGWKVLELILTDRAEYLQKEVNNIQNVDMQEVVKLRIELYYINELLAMPRVLSEGLLAEKEQDHGEQVYE